MADKVASRTTQGAAVLALRPPPARALQEAPPLAPQRWEEAVAVVSVRGDLDKGGLEAIDFAISRACTEAGRIVLDLLGVSHLDYAGVGVLVARRAELSARGGELIIAVRNPYVTNILRAAGGAELVICRSVEEASGAVVAASVPASRARRPSSR